MLYSLRNIDYSNNESTQNESTLTYTPYKSKKYNKEFKIFSKQTVAAKFAILCNEIFKHTLQFFVIYIYSYIYIHIYIYKYIYIAIYTYIYAYI